MSLTSTAVATIALAVAMTSTAARALTLITPALVPDADGYLYCDVVAESATPIGIVAAIVSRDRATVTEFGSGFRASPAATGGAARCSITTRSTICCAAAAAPV